VQWNIETGQSSVIEEGLVEGSLEMEREDYLKIAQEGNDAAKRASELLNLVGYDVIGKGEEEADVEGEKSGMGEGQEKANEKDKKDEEGGKTKEGKPAEVGDKREREGEGGTDAGVAGEQVEAEEGAGKVTKKPKTDQPKETQQKGKKKRGRPAKAKAKTTTPATSEGKKRPVGRPRKGSIAVAKDVVTMEDSGDPAHHTRSKDVQV